MKQHKWHKEIKAWADGAEIEMWYGDRWEKVYSVIEWDKDYEYRIKPQPKDKNEIFKQIQEHIELNMYGHAWDKCQEMIEKSEEKPQPKEPQYLYVYLDDNYELSTIPLDNDEWKYIGKIKLELEDD